MGKGSGIRVEAAYRRVHPRLWHALLAYCGDPDTASDAEAEAFAQALRRGDEVSDVDAWVWRTAFRVAGGLLASRLASPATEPTLTPVEPAIDDPAVVEFLSQLGGLSDQQRAVVVLRYLGGFTPTDIAAVLGTSPGTVRVQLHRAHAQLRTELEDVDGR